MTIDSTPTNHLTPQELDRNLAKFTRWAAGDLTGNRMRGLYAEWMIASQLGVLDEDASRVEWDMVDIRYKSLNIEVKTSGNRQQWSEKENQPRFSIAPQSRIWNAELNQTQQVVPARRTADIYIFCLHTCTELSTFAVANEDNWSFMPVLTSNLDDAFGTQSSVSGGVLSRVGSWMPLRNACEQLERFASPSVAATG